MLREMAITVALENQELRKSLRELADAAFRLEEYHDTFGRWPPAPSKIAKDFNGALSAAMALVGREKVDA